MGLYISCQFPFPRSPPRGPLPCSADFIAPSFPFRGKPLDRSILGNFFPSFPYHFSKQYRGMTIVGTYFDLETRQWLSSGLLAFFERSKKFISYDVFKNPSSFLFLYWDGYSSWRIETSGNSPRWRERERESDEIDIQGTRSNLRKFTIREESTRAELTLLVGRGGLNLLGGRLYRSTGGLKRPPWYLLLPSILSFRPRGVFALSFFSYTFLHQPTPFPCPSNPFPSLFLFFQRRLTVRLIENHSKLQPILVKN